MLLVTDKAKAKVTQMKEKGPKELSFCYPVHFYHVRTSPPLIRISAVVTCGLRGYLCEFKTILKLRSKRKTRE